jgi:hypothetical protein
MPRFFPWEKPDFTTLFLKSPRRPSRQKASFEKAVEAIHAHYLAGFDAVHEFLQAESLK